MRKSIRAWLTVILLLLFIVNITGCEFFANGYTAYKSQENFRKVQNENNSLQEQLKQTQNENTLLKSLLNIIFSQNKFRKF